MTPADGARRALEQARERLRRPLSGGRLQHRADERAHHVPQERIGLDAEHELVAAPLPARRQHLAAEDLVLGLGRREGAEVVLAEERARAAVEQLLRDVARPVPGARRAQRRGCARAQHAVLVEPRAGREARVEALGRRACSASTATSGGRCALSAAGTRAVVGPAVRPSMLTTWPEACTPVSVRPATAGRPLSRPEDPQRLGQDALDRAQARLRGPAVERRPVVLERRAGGLAHRERSSRRWRGGSRRSTSAQRPPPAPITIRASTMKTGGNEM